MEQIYPGKNKTGWLGKANRIWQKLFVQTIVIPEQTSPTGDPDSNTGWLYVKDDGAGASNLYFENDAGSVTDLIANAGGVTLDGAYDYGGAGIGRTINATDGAVIVQSTDADTTNILEINKSPSAGAAGDGIDITMGANATGAGIDINNSGSGNDIEGASWSVSAAGVASFASLSGLTSGLTVNGGTVNVNASSNNATNINTGTSTGAVTIGCGVGTVAINSSSWDISTTGAISGVSTIAASDDITLANGKAVKSSTTTGETVKMQAYDVDNATYRDCITLTNGNTVAIAIGSNTETVAIDSTDWNISATGDITNAGAITCDGALTVNNATVTLYNNEAVTVGHATNGAADDLTISLTGATDSSIILSSAGTGADAVSLQSSAGGVDIDAAAAQDVNIAGGQVLISSKDNAASAIALTANQGANETIVVTNTQGTGAGAVTLTATAGGITLNASSGIVTGDPITGDGTAALGGFLKTITNDTDAHSVLVTESGTVITNAGASGAAAHTLPSAAAGLNYTFIVMAAQELRVTPAAGDAINIGGTQGDAAEYWTANVVGASLTLVAVDATNWIATSYTGTWTQQTP